MEFFDPDFSFALGFIHFLSLLFIVSPLVLFFLSFLSSITFGYRPRGSSSCFNYLETSVTSPLFIFSVFNDCSPDFLYCSDV